MTLNIHEINLPYEDCFKYLCLKNCCHQLLYLNHIENPMLYLFIGFTIHVIKNKADLLIDNDIFTRPFFIDSGIIKSEMYSDPEEAIRENLSYIHDGMQIIAIVDVFYLPYRGEYHKHHAKHAVIMTDYNEEQVMILDWYAPYFFYGKICLKDWLRARNSSNPLDISPFSGRPIKNESCIINIHACESIINTVEANLNYLLNCEFENEKNHIDSEIALKIFGKYIQLFSDNELLMKKIHHNLFLFGRTAMFCDQYIKKILKYFNLRDIKIDLNNLIFVLNKINIYFIKKDYNNILVLFDQLEMLYKKSLKEIKCLKDELYGN